MALTIFLLVAVAIGSIGIDSLQLALFASTIIALFLPISLSPFLILMNDRQYLGDKTNGRFTNIAIICILVMAFVVALVSLPLEIFTGGG
jgi:Mn2+/Fe2+ NRAMP family transporter